MSTDMKSALLHVFVPFTLCVFLANTSLFGQVQVDLTYEHYAEKKVDFMPALLAMPFNCLVNATYVFLGLYWLFWRRGVEETEQSCYLRQVFALMALLYGPVQWTRLATLRRAPAVLDQWFTLPIFAWVLVWLDFVERAKWRASYAARVELCSVVSYSLALAHERGFDVALGFHVALAAFKGIRVQLARGDSLTAGYLLLALLSCAGFVVLKLLDLWLAQFWLFQTLTGHFWSKVFDVLQFHFSFCFLTAMTQRTRPRLQHSRTKQE
ncbi:transmembrane protein 187 [Austrofundulus limnaeus]|uniref:Transmembrane protein 187 n=1 Tax=Austrofundulus limnaeus TaxID=52670 RepID=A0A2I4BTB0_AUSLI|nr:PREDICTED: transmembrane protein 187 [Austrofundulus limnaeus]